MCSCGDTENVHVDNMEQCVIPECGCKEFEEVCGTCRGENIEGCSMCDVDGIPID